MLLALLLSAAAVPWKLPAGNAYDLQGFTPEGRPVAIVYRFANPDDEMNRAETQELAVVMADDGKLLRSCRYEHKVDDYPGNVKLADADGLWARAAEDCSWVPRDHADSSELVAGKPATVVEGLFPLLAEAKGCNLTLLAAPGAMRLPLMEHRCAPRENDDNLTLTMDATGELSPDHKSLVLLWHVRRFRNVAGGGESFDRWYPAIIPLRQLLAVELLDAGAGPALAATRKAIAQAGFAVAAEGKAQKPRPESAIFAAPGTEPVALDLAQSLGLPKSAVQPLTWKARGALVLAAAAK
jgi:hypothetical protein